MNTFPVKFKVGSLNLDAIVTAFDHHQKFKVEMVTDEKDPIRLARSDQGDWTVTQPGQRTISDMEFQELGKAIDAYLDKIYGAKTILVLTDFSDAAFNAASYAAALTHQLKTSCIILYHSLAIPLSTDIPLESPLVAIDFHQEITDQLNGLKDKLQAIASDQIVIEIRSDERLLASAVNALAEQQHAGLVVMGITGKSGLEQTLIGSNTITIAKECSVPLLIVPDEAKFKKIHGVVFACDLKKVSKTTPARAIKTFIHALGAKLSILNMDYDEEHFDPDTILELAALHQLWDKEKPEYHYTDHEDIAKGIMAFADEHQIQLVITVPKQYGFFESLFQRGLTKKLTYHTHIPLLLFKEDE